MLLYLRSNIQCHVLEEAAFQVSDALFCILNIDSKAKFLLSVIYRPPNSTTELDFALAQALSQFISLPHTHILILGDFNLPNLYNYQEQFPPFKLYLSELMNTTPLYNHITNPTRFRSNNNPSLLDLILTNEELMVETVDWNSPLGCSDHVVLTFAFIISMHLNETQQKYRLMTDYSRLKSLILANRWNFADSTDGAEAWKLFYRQFTTLLETCTTRKSCKLYRPPKVIRSRTRKWFSRRNAAWRTFMGSPSNTN